MIQKTWRGVKAREDFHKLVIQELARREREHYTEMATKIQKVWRGYSERKKINFHMRKRLLNSINQSVSIDYDFDLLTITSLMSDFLRVCVD